jgi:hypothetical protein
MCWSPDVLDTWFSSALWPFSTLRRRGRRLPLPGRLLAVSSRMAAGVVGYNVQVAVEVLLAKATFGLGAR